MKTYVLLRAKNGNSDSMANTLCQQPGVVMVDQVEWAADIIFAVKAPSEKRLAEMAVQAISKVEGIANDVQVLPVKVLATPERTNIPNI